MCHMTTFAHLNPQINLRFMFISCTCLPLLSSVSMVTSGVASAGQEVTLSSVWLQSLFVSC